MNGCLLMCAVVPQRLNGVLEASRGLRAFVPASQTALVPNGRFQMEALAALWSGG